MAQVDALLVVEHVRKRLVELSVSENYVKSKSVSDAARCVWEGPGSEGGLVSELWVEGAYPGELSSDSLASLCEKGLFPKDLCSFLDRADAFPADRKLYNHQSEVLRKVAHAPEGENQAFVITAGTGLGKTEAFLLPILEDLWNAPTRRESGGMRCLILYPMNALVSDQIERIYRWLKGQNRIKVFHFTSETPEDARIANKKGYPFYDECRARTRQEARGFESHNGEPVTQIPYHNVPDIVITNYSMLEYMLCRPQDYRFFGPDLRSIVLDEAHLYSGTLAAEIMMLLRRVRQRCNILASQILHIATSATLGGSDQDLQNFASLLFSVQPANACVVRGRYSAHKIRIEDSQPQQLYGTAIELADYSNIDFDTMTKDDDLIEDDPMTVNKLKDLALCLSSKKVVESAFDKFPKTPAGFLFECLQKAPIVRKMADILANEKGNILSLDDLAFRIFGKKIGANERNATIGLLRISAAARLNAADLPLVPHRLHFLVHASEGLSICLNPLCGGPDERKVPPYGCMQPYGDSCRYCEHLLLPVFRCDNCGECCLATYENQDKSALEPAYYAETSDQRVYYLLEKATNLDLEEVVIEPLKGEIRGYGSAGVTLWRAPRESSQSTEQYCPVCHAKWAISSAEGLQPEWTHACRGLIGGRPFALSVTAETVLHYLPPYRGSSRSWKPAEGRRLLAFSDSRASAARLGPLLTQQHEMQVVRAAMSRCVRELVPAVTAQYLAAEVERIAEQLNNRSLGPDLKMHLAKELEDKKAKLASATIGTSFADYAALVSQRQEISQIMDRDLAVSHDAEKFGQSDFKNNNEQTKAHIEGLIATELGRPLKKRATVESVGLIEILYPGLEKLEIPHILEEKLPSNARLHIKKIWPEFVALLLDSARSDGCIDWSKETANRKWLDQSPLVGRWLSRTRVGWGVTAFVGATLKQLRRTFAYNVLQSAGCLKMNLEVLSEEILLAVFDQLFHMAGENGRGFSWLRKEENHQTEHEESDKAIQILLDRLAVRNPTFLYRCDATGTIWNRCAFGWAPFEGCRGTLVSISPEGIDEDLRWGRPRREFKESPIFSEGLWAEEHSAQLSPHENRRLQDLFKNGIRNILSSTTTMELGIDIGGLNGVLLGNVPPSHANHRQRAGRAGRRSDGSALVVTFSRDSDFDRQVFQRFGDFLRRELRKPTVFIDRERIISRHLHAVLLSDFLQSQQASKTGAMQAFGRMGKFCGFSTIPQNWYSLSVPKPSWPPNSTDLSFQFCKYLDNIVLDKDYRDRILMLSRDTMMIQFFSRDEGWAKFLISAKDCFEKARNMWKRDVEQLKRSWDEIPSRPTMEPSREMAKANSIRYMVNALCEITVIEWFADHRFLPRYGFPINLQRLSVRRAIEGKLRGYSEPDERYRLERSSLLALSEYVPGSRVLVGGRVAKSRGLRKHWTDANLDEALGLQSYSLECPDGHIYIRQAPSEVCPRCGLGPTKRQQLVFPRFGYTTAAWEKMPLGTDLERIGEQSVCPIAFAEEEQGKVVENFAGIKKARILYKEEAALLVRNSGRNACGFAICTRCGFALSESEHGQGRMKLPQSFETHASVFSSDPKAYCWQKSEQIAPVLRNRVLAARELTDMLLLDWPGSSSFAIEGIFSLGRALLMAGARLLELDDRELGLVLMPLQERNLGIVIYDTAPGGAGHCQQLVNLGREWLEAARNLLYIDEVHDLHCKRACLDCILDFSGQYSASKLDRRAALELLAYAGL